MSASYEVNNFVLNVYVNHELDFCLQTVNTTCPITTSAPSYTTSTPPSTTSPPPSTTSPPPSTTSPPPSTTSPNPSTTSQTPSTSRALKRVGFLANIKYTRSNLMYFKWILSHDAPVLTAGPPVVYEYLTTIELQTTNVTVIEELRSILDNISYPFPIDSNILISEVNITTGEHKVLPMLCYRSLQMTGSQVWSILYSLVHHVWWCVMTALNRFCWILLRSFVTVVTKNARCKGSSSEEDAAQFVDIFLNVSSPKVVGIRNICMNLWDGIMDKMSFKL